MGLKCICKDVGSSCTVIALASQETHEAFGVEGGDRFVLRDLLGQGGYGAVYRYSLVAHMAHHPNQSNTSYSTYV
eukprot:4511864-Amphidinium_carterae.1